nr:Beta-barrel assembly-enhancing protease [Chlamydiota bacterium]
YSYLGKTKGESLSLKIFDISQKNVLKKIFPVQDLEISRVEQVFEKSNLRSLIEILVHRNLLSIRYLPSSQQQVRQEDCELALTQAIGELQMRDPIPNFSFFQKENPKLTDLYLQLAQTHDKEGEYKEALDVYAKVFQYTKNWSAYQDMPTLFEKMGEPRKAILANLYLAQYQLKDGKLPEAIRTLEKSQQFKSFCLQSDLVLMKLFQFANQDEKAKQLAIKSAATMSKQNRDEAITLYKQILSQNPNQFDLYPCLARLVDNPQEKAQVLLKGACHAVEQEDYDLAEDFCSEASKYSEGSFVDQLISFDLLKIKRNIPAITDKLLLLAKIFEERGQSNDLLRVHKMLFQIEKQPEYCQQIINAYKKLHKPNKQKEWYLIYLSLLITKKDWPKAENIAKKALKKATEAEKVPLYEQLEVVYTHWEEHRLENLWSQLGKIYLANRQVSEAEKVYRKAFERFHGFDQAMALADILCHQGKNKQGIEIYYKASLQALEHKDLSKLTLCNRKIKTIDPHFEHVDVNQRMHLLSQASILQYAQALQEAQQKIAAIEKEKLMLEETVQLEARRRIDEEEQLTKITVLQQTRREELLQLGFGKAQWEKCFGVDIGVEPPLPVNIEEILNRECPFTEGMKVRDTHMLVLIPGRVDGQPHDLTVLSKLICEQTVRDKIGFQVQDEEDYLDSKYREENGGRFPYWVLMTRNFISKSARGCYSTLTTLLGEYCLKSAQPYQVPTALEVATCMFIEYIRTGKRLYFNEEVMCKEKGFGESYINGDMASVYQIGVNTVVLFRCVGRDISIVISASSVNFARMSGFRRLLC